MPSQDELRQKWERQNAQRAACEQHQPGWADLTAEDRALIRRGGKVGFRKIGRGQFQKYIEQPKRSIT